MHYLKFNGILLCTLEQFDANHSNQTILIDDSTEALSSGANDIVAVKQADGSFQSTALEVKVGKTTNWKTMFRSREGKKAKIKVNDTFVLENTELEIVDSGDVFIMRPDQSTKFTSKELKDMNLKNGRNEAVLIVKDLDIEIPFAIYLLNQKDRLVITDVDGTITTSNTIGYICGSFGYDVHHDGAVELFEKFNTLGYIMIYLSARPLGENYEKTRDYLFGTLRPNDKGFYLPISPLILSNVVLLQGVLEAGDPSERKAATVRSIINMFDSKENVVFAAYGNQDSDAKAYVNSGINKKRIFMVDKTSKMKNYGTGKETSYKKHVQDTFYIPRFHTNH